MSLAPYHLHRMAMMMTMMEARYTTETMTTTMIEAGDAVEEEGEGDQKNEEIAD